MEVPSKRPSSFANFDTLFGFPGAEAGSPWGLDGNSMVIEAGRRDDGGNSLPTIISVKQNLNHRFLHQCMHVHTSIMIAKWFAFFKCGYMSHLQMRLSINTQTKQGLVHDWHSKEKLHVVPVQIRNSYLLNISVEKIQIIDYHLTFWDIKIKSVAYNGRYRQCIYMHMRNMISK